MPIMLADHDPYLYHPLTGMYPRTLPDDFDYTMETRTLVHQTEITSPKCLVDKTGHLEYEHRDIQTYLLSDIACELQRIWGLDKMRTAMRMVTYGIPQTRKILHLVNRNPTYYEIAVACDTTPQTVRYLKNVYTYTNDKNYYAYMRGDVGLTWLAKHKSGSPFMRGTKPLFDKRHPNGDVKGVADVNPVNCSLCGRKPRIYVLNGMRAIKCDKELVGGQTYRVASCPNAAKPVVGQSNIEAIEEWNKKNA